MRKTYEQLLLANLLGNIDPEDADYYTSKQKAYEALKQKAYEALKRDTGQDFGLDARAWSGWLNKNRPKEMNWDTVTPGSG